MKLLTISLALLLALTLTSCIEKAETADPLFLNTSPLGAFPKLVEVETNFFNLVDLENSAYKHSVDFIDGRGGKDVNEYKIYLSYEQPNQDTTMSELFRTIGSQEFITRSGTDQLGLDLIIPLAEVAAFLDIDDLSVFTTEAEFNFRTEIVKADGRVFSSLNSTPAITNAFEGIWDFRVKGICPVPEDMFVGEYQIHYGYTYERPDIFGDALRAFGVDLNRAVFLSATDNPLRRDFNYGPYLSAFSFSTNDVSLAFSCGSLLQTPINTNAGCGDGSIGAIQNGVATYDPNDDSIFTIEMIDLPPGFTGGCFSNITGPQLRYSIVFTKN